MFYNTGATSDITLEVVMDLKEINIDNAFYAMFYNNNSSYKYILTQG